MANRKTLPNPNELEPDGNLAKVQNLRKVAKKVALHFRSRDSMLIQNTPHVKSSEITEHKHYLNRRQFIRKATALAVAGTVGSRLSGNSDDALAGERLKVARRGAFSTDEPANTLKDITRYNNFYEFSTSKEDVALLAKNFRTRPWTISVEGRPKKPKTYDIDSLIKTFPLEERVYRFRCVEAWSMVIPWVGFPLADFIKRCEPTSKAKYVELTTLHEPEQMPGQSRKILDWPYVEGLRMDEAMHPLTLLSVGLYGEVLPNQNGAPIRLIVPWKYGFKSVKSIVRIRFTEKQPKTSWATASPKEYGFYANVNPQVDHPRWSQKVERRIPDTERQRKTLMFNGYGEQVVDLYTGMDLKRNF